MSNDIRRLRGILKITQAELAVRSGVDQRTISDLERGANNNPSWETVSRIAAALKVQPQEVFPIGTAESAEPDRDRRRTADERRTGLRRRANRETAAERREAFTGDRRKQPRGGAR